MTVHTVKTVFLGEAAIRLRTDELEAIVVPSWGSRMMSLRRTGDGLEVLRTPQSREQYLARPVLFGVPVLFPPNRLDGGQFTFNGRTYSFPVNKPESHTHIHGVLHRRSWDVIETTSADNRAILDTGVDSEEAEDVFASLPHRFSVRIRFIAEGSTLTQQFVVHNRDEAPLPFGLGYHTAFRFPLSPEGSLDRCSFQLQTDRMWELNERLMPTGRLIDNPFKESLSAGMKLKGVRLDNVFTAADADGANEAVITDPDAGIRIRYGCDKAFGHWVVYNGDGESGFVCPEPYTWVTNAPNLSLPRETTGFRAIEPGAEATFTTVITLSPI